ncbi:Protein ssh4 [Kickxella alabastrina]|uniref:Protein ssh4 n=1 Tax=Kickxella alabastrina TaxID=61397 RepID=A0ACC1I8U9_9FUNG|nr:Protein ssh4 [Kickxella alabastrina]
MMSPAAIGVVTAVCVCILVVLVGFYLRFGRARGFQFPLCECAPGFQHSYTDQVHEAIRHERRMARDRRREEIHRLGTEEVLEKLKNSRAKHNYVYACEYAKTHPIDDSEGTIVGSELEYVIENGASAWEFVPAVENTGITVQNGNEIEFTGGEQSLMANLQFPNEQRVYYFEVRLDSLPEGTNMAIGVAMKSYPPLRMAGWANNSVAYHTIDGAAYYSHPLDACRKCIRARTSDTVGVGWRPYSGKIFFAINGAIVCHIRTPWVQKRLYPIVSADGPCSVNVNVGVRAFVLSHANMRYWGLAPPEGIRLPPPMYQNASDCVLLDASQAEHDSGDSCSALSVGPPSYDGGIHMYSKRYREEHLAIDVDRDSLGSTNIGDAGGLSRLETEEAGGYPTSQVQSSRAGVYRQDSLTGLENADGLSYGGDGGSDTEMYAADDGESNNAAGSGSGSRIGLGIGGI